MQDNQFQRIQALAKAVRSWKEVWLIGRGRPVGRAALKESGAVSDNYLDDITELVKDLGRDGVALLTALRERNGEHAKGFYDSKADELEAYFEQQGYIDRREEKSQEEMWQYVLADVTQERKADVIDIEAMERLFERVQDSSFGDG